METRQGECPAGWSNHSPGKWAEGRDLVSSNYKPQAALVWSLNNLEPGHNRQSGPLQPPGLQANTAQPPQQGARHTRQSPPPPPAAATAGEQARGTTDLPLPRPLLLSAGDGADFPSTPNNPRWRRECILTYKKEPEMTYSLTEIKKLQEGIDHRVEEAEDWMGQLEDRVMESKQAEQQKQQQ